MKALTQVLWIVVTIIVILIVAIVLLSMFGIQIGSINKILIDWMADISTSWKGLTATG